MQYRISAPLPQTRMLEIEFVIDNVNDDVLKLYLPSWRPGRYELGNFARNIQRMEATDEKGQPLPIHKVSKDSWVIETRDISSVSIRYNYYAAQPDAGACWVDNELIYINPVHCCIYAEERLHLSCKVILDIPSDWKVASGLIEKPGRVRQAVDYHQLVDCPIVASNNLQHDIYISEGITFHLWFAGKCKPDWKKILEDFKAFTEVQLKMMGSFPSREYHFLILILPYRFYHGVEHTNSTVLALGPGYNLMQEELYTDLLGVASHELFHAWNIKTIRPADMLPYRYHEENYSRLGWVYEGFTTYYGDLFLARSGYFSMKQYFSEVNSRLQRHFDNYGRFNLSVAASSFDTWLDGYAPGIPHRKTSIYDEGSLIALILDLFIRKHSDWKFSLDDVMQSLYKDFALKNRGYKEHDVKMLTDHYSGADSSVLFGQLINGVHPYMDYLQELLFDAGCYISVASSKNLYEHLFGFKIISEGSIYKVSSVAPGSPAEKAGLSKDDELICLNNTKVEGNLNDLLKMEEGKKMTLEVFTMRQKKTVELSAGDKNYYSQYTIELLDEADSKQKERFTKWTGIKL